MKSTPTQSISFDASNFAAFARQILANGGEVTFIARGFSMRPVILDRSRVTVAATKADQIEQGDIILFQGNAQPLLHRVLSISTDHQTFQVASQSGRHMETIKSADLIGCVIRVRKPPGAVLSSYLKSALRRAITLLGGRRRKQTVIPAHWRLTTTEPN